MQTRNLKQGKTPRSVLVSSIEYIQESPITRHIQDPDKICLSALSGIHE